MVPVGKIEEKAPARKIYYVPPSQIEEASAKVTITVRATDDTGNITNENIILHLRSSLSGSEPDLTPLPAEIVRLLETAEKCFRGTSYTEPKGQNAYELYRKVLRLAPENRIAHEKIQKMAENYKLWWDREYNKKNNAKAAKYYQRYLLIAAYLLTELHEQSIEAEMCDIR